MYFAIFNPVVNFIMLIFIVLILIKNFFHISPPGLLDYYTDLYFMTFFPIVLSFIITPTRITKDKLSKILICIVITVRLALPLGFYLFMGDTIIKDIRDLPSTITRKYESIQGILKTEKASETLQKYNTNKIIFRINGKKFMVSKKDYFVMNNFEYKVLYLKNGDSVIDIFKVDK